MKKGCIGILLKFILAILLLRFVAPLVLMAAMVLFVSGTKDSGNEAGRALLQDVGMVEMARFAPAELLTVEESLTVMNLPWYDNREDNTDLRAQFLQEASTVTGWEIVSVSPEEAASLWPAEAAFLLPDATFEARYAREDGVRALYDADTGLFIHLTGKKPATAHFLRDGLNVTRASAQYELNTHGGFHRDGETYFALVVPPEQRGKFVEELSSRPEWHRGAVSSAEYRQLLERRMKWLPLCVYPAEGIEFDWWFWRDEFPGRDDGRKEYGGFPAEMTAEQVYASANWVMALYDADTGLLIWYAFDS